MNVYEIERVVEQFAAAARSCKAAGFTGVQIHAAHGYLISSFLSPKANIRHDQWGGPLENRSRLLLTIIAAVRRQVGPSFPISVKGTGCIGAVTVSGLPQRDDHNLAVEALALMLAKDLDTLRLAPL